jgi:O-antigen ligase
MPPLIAAAGCVAFIAYLFWNDIKKRGGRSLSWAPLIWMFLAGSRYVSSWLSLNSPIVSVDDYSEGSPVDRLVFLGLIVWGVVVLSRRNIDWGRLFRKNAWIGLYLLYALSSMMWADDPFVLFKRWIKDLGTPVMVLVLLTEARPYEALGITLRRLSFLLLPGSVLFILYFPELGRAYHSDGAPMYTGVGHQKNDLGLMCLTAGIYQCWKLLQRRNGQEWAEKTDVRDLVLIGMLAWLLHMSNSQTSLVCLLTATSIMILSRMPFIAKKPSRAVGILAVGAIGFYTLQAAFDIKATILTMLGRDPTFTGRTELWEVISRFEANPLIGAGFMSFWQGDRMAGIWAVLGGGINQAHNGYFEQYLNLGYIGLGFIGSIVLAAVWSVRKQINADQSGGTLRLCFLAVAVLYNFTEASFYGVNNMWLLLIAASMDVGVQAMAAQAIPVAVASAPRTLQHFRFNEARSARISN